ncbi:helix-turn-helix transcriptional regulator [Nesterenkonia lacusekhoensis]|uniref:Transcriptional regulator with XRE-family HTH domain n=1 Tax=Nesterenkonia lacusekhoensis TaxID=150832 RepID=A0ABS4SYZ4_9MICC|nr:helix-turn-helix transcriptional regulator [Nesterenkonia lacusekhoensis]MBP2317353.1 transcriptional regulator with XRE-family HTH domain [Nesterenkonia lacusekhoensis]
MTAPTITKRGVFYVELISTDALRQYMKYRGYSVKGLADRIKVSKATIGHLHSGGRRTVGPEIAKSIEKALDAPIGSLFLPKVSTAASSTYQRGRRAA